MHRRPQDLDYVRKLERIASKDADYWILITSWIFLCGWNYKSTSSWKFLWVPERVSTPLPRVPRGTYRYWRDGDMNTVFDKGKWASESLYKKENWVCYSPSNRQIGKLAICRFEWQFELCVCVVDSGTGTCEVCGRCLVRRCKWAVRGSTEWLQLERVPSLVRIFILRKEWT